MSLFVCSGCNAVENTALSSFWTQGYENRGTAAEHLRLCSECLNGKWHGKFPKRPYDGTQHINWIDGSWVEPTPDATQPNECGGGR